MSERRPWDSAEWLPMIEGAESKNPALGAWLRERCETVEALMVESERLMSGWRQFVPGNFRRAMRLIGEAHAVTDDIRTQGKRLHQETERS